MSDQPEPTTNGQLIDQAAAPSESAAAAVSPASEAPASSVTVEKVTLALRRVKDPELNLNIVDLGLVYDVRVDGTVVDVDMSLTSPGCPSGAEITGDAEQAIRAMPDVSDVTINLVWTPYWSPERIEPRVRAYLGF